MTGTAPTPAPAPSPSGGTPPGPPAPAEYRCRRCNRLLGVQHPDRLHLGGAHVLGKVMLACAACGRRWVWSGPVDNLPPRPA